MSPKFNGGSDDWLDDEDSSGSGAPVARVKKKKTAANKATQLPAEEANAVVVEVFPNQCAVRLDGAPAEKNVDVLCSYRRSQLMDKESEIRDRSPVAVGDRVKVELTGSSTGVVEALCIRKNQLVRPAPARATRHVLVSNIDQLVIVTATQNPEFSPGLVDRFLIAASVQGIPAVICINKIDLHASVAGVLPPWKTYEDLGYPVIEVSAKRDLGVAQLQEITSGKLTVFCGHSGVGKTSLLSVLLQREAGRVGEVSDFTGKGRHTTTGAILLRDSHFIDTPGVRAFGLIDVSPEKLHTYFPEFSSPAQLGCAQKDCLHMDEADCKATSLARYSSYRRIFESIRSGEN
ncbi:MAG: ribosome small subunit-dependent GTPase A [Methylotenera sp.]|nr:ribosome small subunit-dependent GTPase A [Oligoflexia bacterium]